MSLYLMKIVFTQIGNIFFVDVFLGGAFLKYGTEVVRYSGMDQENRTDPMIAVFPRVTKCTFHKFGPSGKKRSCSSVLCSCSQHTDSPILSEMKLLFNAHCSLCFFSTFMLDRQKELTVQYLNTEKKEFMW